MEGLPLTLALKVEEGCRDGVGWEGREGRRQYAQDACAIQQCCWGPGEPEQRERWGKVQIEKGGPQKSGNRPGIKMEGVK